MKHIIVSVIAALAMSIVAYDATGSFVAAFLVYVGTGSLVLTMALLAGFMGYGDDLSD